jgi:tetraacyldisaccharide 4'-kinase
VRLAPVAALRPLGRLWGHIAKIRRELYQAGLFRVEKAPLPVVSVGNLTMGGNGKTPMCAFLARSLASLGLKPAIVSRGYRRKRSLPDPLVVSIGSGPLVSAPQAGDEPFLLASVTKAIVVCARRRIEAARKAFDLGADLVILDDGFQHLSLFRDLDILMLRAPVPWTEELVIPAGPLREPKSAHRWADALVGVGDSLGQALAPLAGSRPLFRGSMEPTGFIELPSLKKRPLGYPKSLQKAPKIMAFCGLANPASFYQALTKLGLNPEARLDLPDHAGYGPEALESLRELTEGVRPDFLITTAKDAVKLGLGPEGLRPEGLNQEGLSQEGLSQEELNQEEAGQERLSKRGSGQKEPSQEQPSQERPGQEEPGPAGLSRQGLGQADDGREKLGFLSLGRPVLVLEADLKLDAPLDLLNLILSRTGLAAKASRKEALALWSAKDKAKEEMEGEAGLPGAPEAS